MLTKEALEYLNSQAAALAVNALRETDDIDEGEVPRIALPNEVTLQSLEPFMSVPVRFRGAFSTTSINAFADYLHAVPKRPGEAPVVFIDPVAMKAVSYFDLGTHAAPGWGDHHATLQVPQTPEMAALVKHALTAGYYFSQRDFIDFMGDWAPNLSFYDEELVQMNTAAVIRAVQNIKIEEKSNTGSAIGNYNAERTTLESVDVKAKAGEVLPATMHFTCAPYEEFETRTFECSPRAVVRTDKSARLAYHVSGLEAMKLKIAEEFERRIADRLSEAVTLHLGTFKRG